MATESLRRHAWPLLLLAAAGCGDIMSPIRNLGKVGEDPYLVFVAQARDGASELFVARPDGRNIRPITFSPIWESRPALSPDGAVLAFLRSTDTLPATPRTVWVTNLLNGKERQLQVPATTPTMTRMAWSADGQQLFAESATGAMLVWPMPPANVPGRMLTGAERTAALLRFEQLLGDPPFARIVPCVDGEPKACVQPLNDTTGARAPLADFDVRDAVRWRGDSVGYLIGDSLRVRPLSRGRERRIEWGPATPLDPRQFTFFPGAPPRR